MIGKIELTSIEQGLVDQIVFDHGGFVHLEHEEIDNAGGLAATDSDVRPDADASRSDQLPRGRSLNLPLSEMPSLRKLKGTAEKVLTSVRQQRNPAGTWVECYKSESSALLNDGKHHKLKREVCHAMYNEAAAANVQFAKIYPMRMRPSGGQRIARRTTSCPERE